MWEIIAGAIVYAHVGGCNDCKMFTPTLGIGYEFNEQLSLEVGGLFNSVGDPVLGVGLEYSIPNTRFNIEGGFMYGYQHLDSPILPVLKLEYELSDNLTAFVTPPFKEQDVEVFLVGIEMRF